MASDIRYTYSVGDVLDPRISLQPFRGHVFPQKQQKFNTKGEILANKMAEDYRKMLE